MKGVVVSYRAPELIFNAVTSIKRFHKRLPILIVDGSGAKHECRKVIQSLCKKYPDIETQFHAENVGHGVGLHLGIQAAKTKNVLIFDSDIIVRRPFIADMLIHRFIYGIGQIIHVDEVGKNADTGFRYLHPHFAIINSFQYFKHRPFVNRGAPLINAMKEMHGQNLLIDFPVQDYVTHLERGTVNILRGERNPTKMTPATKHSIQHHVLKVGRQGLKNRF